MALGTEAHIAFSPRYAPRSSRPKMSPMTVLGSARTLLAPRIEEASIDALTRLVEETGTSSLAELCTATAAGALRSGKKFRAFLAFLGAHLASHCPLEEAPVLSLAAALELYQASALVHDDVIDRADLRRSSPTSHRIFERAHRESQWRGDAEHFGTSGAILVGDLLFSAAEYAIGEHCASLSPHDARAVMSLYTRMHAEVALGQYLDIRAEHVPCDPRDEQAISVDAAFEVMTHKAAHYSVVHPALLGALSCGASPEFTQALTQILTPWGLAFQMRDDDLGVFGSSELTGKPSGDDLREGKRTVLLALAWRGASPKERAFLASAVGKADMSDEECAQVADLIRVRGRGEHEALISRYAEEGYARLSELSLSEQDDQLLREVAQMLIWRDL